MGSPTQRSLALLRERGWMAAVVERWSPHAKVRQDLFGFIDIVAVSTSWNGVVGIQTTTMANLAARQEKIAETCEATTWLRAGNWILVHGWAKKGPRGKRKVWTCVERCARYVENYGQAGRIEWEEV